MKEILEKIKNIESECCVTIVFNTHRNKPDIQKDAIMLKNMVAEAEERLYSNYDKKLALSISERLENLAGAMDHSHNLESMVVFVNEEMSEVAKLPIEVENRIVIGNTFAIRELIRALQLELAYFILVLTRDSARLIEAFNDAVLEEVDNPFPVVNETLYLTSAKALSKAKQKDQMIEEFFNRVDKTLLKVVSEKPYLVVICTEERNFSHYMKIADRKEDIIGHFSHSVADEKAGNLVKIAWPVVKAMVQQKNVQRKTELQKALNAGLVLSDTGEIMRAVNEGRGQVLFVQDTQLQPILSSMSESGEYQSGPGEPTEGFLDKIIEINFKNGGDVVFLPEEDLSVFNGVALVTRF